MIKTEVMVSDELGSDMLIMNNKGKTTITIKHDMRDPEINEVV